MTPTTAASATRATAASPATEIHRAPTTEAAPSGGAAEDWAAVATALNTRLADCRFTQQRLADLSRVSVATIRVLQRGIGTRRVRDSTLAALSHALGWPEGHLLHVLLADSPDTPTGQTTCTPLAGLDARQHPHRPVDRPAPARPPAAPGDTPHPLAQITTELDAAGAVISDARAHLAHTDQLRPTERDLAAAWLETATARLEQTQTLLAQAATTTDAATTPTLTSRDH
ncbi:hypothetical protein I6A84_04525 [Frankia sp. CNm7]|uniref:Uncharacterized protein n=1 Tax=Frankia nepalensis TaxID=1836974 RepID=A0A937UNG8_9ACTN|nr:hypothetical protein [Frankia nepalensis]MBL7498730.1 hypothetical protein [Frankia nepalensis]MBL7508405.1 hypothetical protein [Frankia nepalensis]MBL7517405.1 hypothetical protein [Frankia nepalensis]MBL7626235.1 hypothetical protein [Frankia nepalensis]